MPPKVDRKVTGIFSILLPRISLHRTEDSARGILGPKLIADPASVISPLDIDARAMAHLAGVSESNVLYRSAHIFHELRPIRTWLCDKPELDPESLSMFLDAIDLRFSHNKPEISPATHAIARVAAELYDAGQITGDQRLALALMFTNYDPQMYLRQPQERLGYIERIGGFDYSQQPYIKVPNDWLETSAASLPLLRKRSGDGRVIAAEWTRLKRLDDNWPVEERMSLIRVGDHDSFTEEIDPNEEEIPFAWVRGAHINDYLAVTDLQASELIIAHNGYNFHTWGNNWLGLNPQVGYEMGWTPLQSGWFRWMNAQHEIVVESIWWQDGPFDLFSLYDHVEVGDGWVVLMSPVAYRELRQRYGTLTRGGVAKRSLGWLGSMGRNTSFGLTELD